MKRAMRSDDEGDNEGDDEELSQDTFQQLCFDYIDLVARNQINVSGVANIIEVQNKQIRQHLDPAVRHQFPTSWHNIKKRCKIKGSGGKSFYRHFCPACDHLFEVDLRDDTCDCGGLRFNKHGKAIRRALYYDISDKLVRLLRDG